MAVKIEINTTATDRRDIGGGYGDTVSPTSSTVTETNLDQHKPAPQFGHEGHELAKTSEISKALDDDAELTGRKFTASKQAAILLRNPSRALNHDVEKGETSAVRDESAKAAEVDDNDNLNVIFWDSEDDPANPYNWPGWLKVVNCSMVGLITFITPMGSAVFAPGVPDVMREFKSDSNVLASFVVSIYILGFALGPLVLAPLSEIYGRMPVYHVCNIGFLALMIASALAPSLASLIVFRFLSGIFGSCPLTNGAGSIADMVRQEKRAAAMSAFSVGPLLGPAFGPIAGGFLIAAKGWRWLFWILAILTGVVTIVMLIFMRETFAPVILQRKVNQLRKQTGNTQLRSKLRSDLSTKEHLKRNIIRPCKLLVRSPVCAYLAVYTGLSYGYQYLLLTAITDVFENVYGFPTKLSGLGFLGLALGSFAGIGIFSMTSDKYLEEKALADGRGLLPEYRLQLMPLGAVLLPTGFFIFGWTARYHVHWIVPIFGTAVTGTGTMLLIMAIQMYLVDAFEMYAASALASNTAVRSILGAFIPLGGLPMFKALGLGWGCSLLGLVAFAMVPFAFIFLRKGEQLRIGYPVKNL